MLTITPHASIDNLSVLSLGILSTGIYFHIDLLIFLIYLHIKQRQISLKKQNMILIRDPFHHLCQLEK